jgi:hypothetical protein
MTKYADHMRSLSNVVLKGKEVLPGIEDQKADPTRQFYSNIMSP